MAILNHITPKPAEQRFVVLEHNDRAGIHYDLMIEQGDSLATWKSAVPPEQFASHPGPLRRIADHRKLYLDYEGPIPDGRGFVVQHDSGLCLIHRADTDFWDVTFQGARLIGRCQFERTPPDQNWRFSASET